VVGQTRSSQLHRLRGIICGNIETSADTCVGVNECNAILQKHLLAFISWVASVDTPYAWRHDFKQMAVWIAEVERFAPIFPRLP
jgi:hypothetical protein